MDIYISSSSSDSRTRVVSCDINRGNKKLEIPETKKRASAPKQPTSWNPTQALQSLLSRFGPSTSIPYLRAHLFPGSAQVAWMVTARTSGIMINPFIHRDLEWAGAQFPDSLMIVLRIVSDRLVLYPQHVVMLPCCRKQRGEFRCHLRTWAMDTQTRLSRGAPSCNHTPKIRTRNRSNNNRHSATTNKR